MKKNYYLPPKLWVTPIMMESVICTSGTGEGMDPWEGDGALFIQSIPFDHLEPIF